MSFPQGLHTKQAMDEHRQRVLVIDDDPVVEVVVDALLEAGFETRAEADGASGRRAFSEWAPELVLLDAQLPDENGLDVCRRLRALPGGESTTIVMMTGSDDADTVRAAFLAGATEYTRKPFQPMILTERLRHILRARNSMERATAEQHMASLGQFAAGLAHEVNNPLMYVSANLDYLATTPEIVARMRDTEMATVLEETREGVRRISSLIADLRLVSHPTMGSHESASLTDILDEQIRILGRRLSTRARIERNYQSRGEVFCQPLKIARVVMNLLSNAADAIPAGEPEKNVVELTVREDDRAVILEVSDSGSGIDPYVQRRLFQPFFTTKGVGTGVGIGLAMCRSIVESHHGTIRIDSEKGKGTRVVVSLPKSHSQSPERV